MIQKNLLIKQKRFKDLEKELRVAGGEGIVRDFGKVMNTLLYLKWITNRDLLCNTWNCPMLCTSLDGRVAWRRISSVQFSCSVVSDSLWSRGLQHTSLPWCPSPTPGLFSNSCPSSWWCHSTISSSLVSFSCLQSFSASGSLLMSQFFASGGQSIGISASA